MFAGLKFSTVLAAWLRLLICSSVAHWSEPGIEQVRLAAETEKHDATTNPLDTTDRVIVLGRLPLQNTTWVQQNLAHWQDTIYTTDSSKVLPEHQESSVLQPQVLAYMTYLLMSSLSASSIAFIDPRRISTSHRGVAYTSYQGVQKPLKRLDLAGLDSVGYARISCESRTRCSVDSKTFKASQKVDYGRESDMQEVWETALSRGDVLDTITIMCCGVRS